MVSFQQHDIACIKLVGVMSHFSLCCQGETGTMLGYSNVYNRFCHNSFNEKELSFQARKLFTVFPFNHETSSGA